MWVCQLVRPPMTCWPVFAVTLTTCQSCCGDHQNARSSFAGLVTPTCSTLKGPFGVCQLVGEPAAFAPVILVTSTIPGSITTPSRHSDTQSPSDNRAARRGVFSTESDPGFWLRRANEGVQLSIPR